MNRRLACTGLAVATLVCGLILRMAPLGLPWAVSKYGGSALWAVMIYWLSAMALPNTRPLKLGVLSSAIAIAVEFGKLYRSPAMDAFRLTLAGKLLLGRFFSIKDIVAYLAGIGIAVALDAIIQPKTSIAP